MAAGLLLALVLGAGAWFSHGAEEGGAPPVATVSPTVTASAPAAPSAPTGPPAPRPGRPDRPVRPGSAYPVHDLGSLGDRSRLVTLRGAAELRYARAPGNGTRVHFICTGCDAATRLVEWSDGRALRDVPLADPGDATTAVDVVQPRRTSRLLVRSPRAAEWTLTLTPFDQVPVHETGFDTLGDDVVAVRAQGAVLLRCPGASRVLVLSRPHGSSAYAVAEVQQHDVGGTYPLGSAGGAGWLVLVVECPGRWTLTLA